MDPNQLLPIKVVFPRPEDFRAPPPGGGAAKIFGPVDAAVRATFATEVRDVARHFDRAFQAPQKLPAVAKVTLKPEAVAKSHRPTELFNPDTCPIIGGNKLGELYVSVEPRGLDRLAQQIEKGTSKHVEANISTLKAIKPYDKQDVFGGSTLEEFQQKIARDQRPLRVRLFRYHSPALDAQVDALFEEVARDCGIGDLARLDYAEGLRLYRVRDPSPERVATLANFVGLQSLSVFPAYRIVRTTSRTLGNITAVDFPAPEPGREYPLVGLIDSGTDPDNPLLQAWVANRLDLHPRDRQDNGHGSFVAGLIAHGRRLNHNDERFPSVSSRIVDVVAFDKDGEITEDDLLVAIDSGLQRFPEVKVWNLSLGSSDPCGDDSFSEFGTALDERAERNGVLFVVAAGNYNVQPLRAWPPQGGIGEADRICPPADAMRALTVGSVAHLETAGTCVRSGEPSPFSRRGPGPAYVIKPELTFYGGNCDATGQYVQAGIVSIDGHGHKAENIGTSFANPLASSLAANVEAELRTPSTPNPRPLVKALMLHGAFLRNAPLETPRINYAGLGCPPDLSQIINCRQSAATVILQVPVRTKPDFGKRPFPMPPCLFHPTSGLQCEVFMTLMYEPPLDRKFGIEYCRCNVNASLGTLGINPKTGKEDYNREVLPVPKELSDAYEEELIKHGYKWSPLKLYYRKFSRGPQGKLWRLTLEMLNRSDHESDDEQEVVVIVTLVGKTNNMPVYDELVREMDRLGWGAQDLQVRSRLRTQY